MNLMICIGLILSDRPRIISQLGTSAGKLIGVSNNPLLGVSSGANSLLGHFHAFGHDLAALTQAIVASPRLPSNGDLKTCTYVSLVYPTPSLSPSLLTRLLFRNLTQLQEFLSGTSQKYPVTLRFDTLERVKALFLFYASAIQVKLSANSTLLLEQFHR